MDKKVVVIKLAVLVEIVAEVLENDGGMSTMLRAYNPMIFHTGTDRNQQRQVTITPLMACSFGEGWEDINRTQVLLVQRNPDQATVDLYRKSVVELQARRAGLITPAIMGTLPKEPTHARPHQ